MTHLHHREWNRSIQVDRIIGHVQGSQSGACVIFTAGVHGNEPSGVFALHEIIRWLTGKEDLIRGSVYALSGNLAALQSGQRFQSQDLNRLWTTSRMARIKTGELKEDDPESREQLDLFYTLQSIIEREKGPFYFMDLHTTSSDSCPFLTVNDSLLNRKFTAQYPLPIILGIEEYLEGPLLSYFNEQGYVAFGFEGGQHESREALQNHEAFCMLSLVFAGIIKGRDANFSHYYQHLTSAIGPPHLFYEIVSRYAIREDESFRMKPGFKNFQLVQQGEVLAHRNDQLLRAPEKFRIFMPLYQSQGHDAYFSIVPVPRLFLKLSLWLREWGIDRLMVLLPGVRWASRNRTALIINRRVARFFTREIFHLLGYRSRQLSKNHLLMKNREAAARKAEYKDASWY